MRMKVEDVEVDDPKEAMRKFKTALAQIVKVPKSAIKRKRAKSRNRRKA
jgi:hypothetical protein